MIGAHRGVIHGSSLDHAARGTPVLFKEAPDGLRRSFPGGCAMSWVAGSRRSGCYLWNRLAARRGWAQSRQRGREHEVDTDHNDAQRCMAGEEVVASFGPSRIGVAVVAVAGDEYPKRDEKEHGEADEDEHAKQ